MRKLAPLTDKEHKLLRELMVSSTYQGIVGAIEAVNLWNKVEHAKKVKDKDTT